ncbi:MAG: calcium/sodium antiporter [Bacteroidetes bacterium]|nr:calcium/sodium antiporter [Bacteroidota bacterium]
MDVLQSFAQMGIGIVLLLVGAEGLVRGASALALRFGLTPLVVGLTVVAFGTSSPELVVSVQAALSGDGGFAVGNVVGSNVANLALIVGISAALSPMVIQRSLIRWDLPVMLASAIILVLFLYNGRLGRMEGAVLTAGIIAYLTVSIRSSRKEVRAMKELELPDQVEEAAAEPEASLWRHLLLTLGGLALLVLGSNQLLAGAITTAERLGVSKAVIGLTIVAAGTSLPELATTVVAALRKHGDIALGNAIGSNVFNAFGVLGPAALVQPMNREGVGFDVAVGDDALLIMLGVTVLTFGLLWTGFRTRRWEGYLLIAIYGLYLWWVIPK